MERLISVFAWSIMHKIRKLVVQIAIKNSDERLAFPQPDERPMSLFAPMPINSIKHICQTVFVSWNYVYYSFNCIINTFWINLMCCIWVYFHPERCWLLLSVFNPHDDPKFQNSFYSCRSSLLFVYVERLDFYHLECYKHRSTGINW